MEANELSCKDLMVGDWVKPKNVDVSFRVGLIGVDSVWNDTDTHEWDYDELEPISLTADILEKNGFKSQLPKNHLEIIYAYQDVSEAVADELYALWPHRDGSFYLLLRVDGKDMVRMNVHYVHQLQHTLRLCGIKKEIVL